MPNSNPQAVAFANYYARKAADEIVTSYLTMKRFLQVWAGQSIVTVIPPNDSNVLVDGSATDGRAPITNAQVNVLVANATTLVAAFEASADLILNQTLQVAVNSNSVLN